MKNICLVATWLLVFMSLVGCKEEAVFIADETAKDIAGKWRIVNLTRNGENITERIDVSKFRLIFKEDGTYSLEDKMSFAVNQPGMFKLGDPQYPFNLTLTPAGGGAPQKLKLQYPIIEGKRQLSLTLTQGCSSNVYQFNFAQTND